MQTIDLPLLATLDGTFLDGLNDGAAVRSADGRAVRLVDDALRTVAVVPLPELPHTAVIRVTGSLRGALRSEPSGLVAVAHDTGLTVWDLAGAEVYRREHAPVYPHNDCVFNGRGTLLWALTPEPAVEVFDTRTWWRLGAAPLDPDPDWPLAWWSLVGLEDFERGTDGVVVQGTLDDDGTFGVWLELTDRLAGGRLPNDVLVQDTHPLAELLLLLDADERALSTVYAGLPGTTTTLDWADLGGRHPGGDVEPGRWHGLAFLDQNRIIGRTAAGQVLLLDALTLQPDAELRPAGYDADPFTGWDRAPLPAGRRPASVRCWSDDRIVLDDRYVYEVS